MHRNKQDTETSKITHQNLMIQLPQSLATDITLHLLGWNFNSHDVTKPCHVCTFVSIAGTDMFKCAGNGVVTVILVSLE
jgi:hypothetical protein